MILINQDTMKGRQLTDEQAAKLKKAINAGNVSDEFGDLLIWEDIIDINGDIVLEEGGYENCLGVIEKE